jgi:F-type H+-transporting ATPase subunit b
MADPAHSTDTEYDFTATSQVPHESHGDVDPMEISGQMVVWTWVVFALMLLVLYKVAWKPILAVLDQREKDIQDTIDNAARIRAELDDIEKTRARIIGDADEKSRAVLDAARKGAQEQARTIEAKARDEAQILMANASREIENSRAKAEDELRIESAAWARELAGKLIEANLDDEMNRALTDKLIQEL